MNSSQPTHDPAAEEQAALWAARLDGGSLEHSDRAALDAWLAANAGNRTLLSQYCQFSTDLESQLPVLVAAGAVKMPSVTNAPRKSWRATWIGFGSLAAAAAVTFAVWNAWPAHSVENIATAVAQRQTVTLADGTRVELNARTSLLVENTKTERHVRLAEGEAFFTVSKDPMRPFIVETPAGSVRVTGTVFNVCSEAASQLEVTVAEGSVQVRPRAAGASDAAPVALSPGDRLVASATGVSLQKLSSDALENTLAWRTGQIVFEGTPLREALARFARYHGRSIVAAPAVESLTVGGRYSLEDLDEFLAALEAALPVRVTHDLSGAVLVGPRTGG
jgi:transmembrane sensor